MKSYVQGFRRAYPQTYPYSFTYFIRVFVLRKVSESSAWAWPHMAIRGAPWAYHRRFIIVACAFTCPVGLHNCERDKGFLGRSIVLWLFSSFSGNLVVSNSRAFLSLLHKPFLQLWDMEHHMKCSLVFRMLCNTLTIHLPNRGHECPCNLSHISGFHMLHMVSHSTV